MPTPTDSSATPTPVNRPANTPSPDAPSVADARVVRTGERVAIRHPVAEDRAELLALRRDSRDHLERWEPRPVDGVSTWGGVWFDRFLAQSRLPTSQRFLVVRRTDGTIVGQVSLGQIYRGPFANACMGYWVGAGHTRCGYASAGIRLVLDQAFGTLGLHRVEVNIMPSNEPSLAVARRVGFRLEGYSPKYLQIDGVWADHTRWALTAEDWPPGDHGGQHRGQQGGQQGGRHAASDADPARSTRAVTTPLASGASEFVEMRFPAPR